MCSSDLGHNGYVALGRTPTLAIMKIRRPDDVPAAKFYADSQMFMDMVMKAAPMHRTVGPENIRMISLGKAHDEAMFTDAWGRKWQMRQW